MKALAELIRTSGAALLNSSWDGLSVESLVELLVGGRRASTLRARARAWRRFQDYLFLSCGGRHPRDVKDYLDYVRTRASEPCSQAVLRGIQALYAFIDHMTGVTRPAADVALVKSAFKEYMSQAPARRAGDGRPAARYLYRMLLTMEKRVMDADAVTYDRLICWWTLATCWCTLRFDDHRGMVPAELRQTCDGWSFDLRRSKTTGPGKQVAARPCHLSGEAHFGEKAWFSTGLRLWEEAAPFERDFMLCIPTPCMTRTVHREITHDEFTARLRRLIADLSIEDVRLGENAARWYTPHSGRNFLPSAVIPVLKGTDEDIRKLGAWSTKGGGAYVRTIREHTRAIQTAVAVSLRASGDSMDPLCEGEDLDALRRHLISAGECHDKVDQIVNALSWKSGFEEVPSQAASPTMHDERETVGRIVVAGGSRAAGSTDPLKGGDGDSPSVGAPVVARAVDGYVCSVLGRRQVRRLHFVGLCYRRPGWDYKDYVHYGAELPNPGDYDLVCRQCWPEGRPGLEGEVSSVVSTDESSSTNEEE